MYDVLYVPASIEDYIQTVKSYNTIGQVMVLLFNVWIIIPTIYLFGPRPPKPLAIVMFLYNMVLAQYWIRYILTEYEDGKWSQFDSSGLDQEEL